MVDALAYGALFFALLSLVFRAPRLIMAVGVASLSLWCLYFGIMGLLVPLGMTLVSLARNVAGAWVDEAGMRRAVPALVAALLFFGAGSLLLEGESSLLFLACSAGMVASSVVKAIAIRLRDRPLVFRLVQIAAGSMAIPFVVVFGTVPMMIDAAIFQSVLLATTLWHHGREMVDIAMRRRTHAAPLDAAANNDG